MLALALAGGGMALWLLWPDPSPGPENPGPETITVPAPTLPADPTPPPAADPRFEGLDPQARQEWELARQRFDEAYTRYTTLATTGGEGSIQEALDLYRRRYEELQEVERKWSLPPGPR
jgi:hypothetical protein